MSDLNDQVQIQGFCLKYVNQEIDNFFGNDTSGNRPFLKNLIKHKEFDSFMMTIARLVIKNEIFNQFDDYIFGYPSTAFRSMRANKPNICLKFREYGNKPNNRDYQRLQVTCQMPDQYHQKFNINKLPDLAKKIHDNFKDFKFMTGYEKSFYRDESERFQIAVFPQDNQKGKDLINKFIRCFDAKYDPKKLTLGKMDAKPSEGIRSITSEVKFYRAEYLTGKTRPLKIADRNWWFGKKD